MFLFQTQKQQKHEADKAQEVSRSFVVNYLRIDPSTYAKIQREKGGSFSFDYQLNGENERKAYSDMRNLLMGAYSEMLRKVLVGSEAGEQQLVKQGNFNDFLEGISALIAYKIIQKAKELGGVDVGFHEEVISICSDTVCGSIDVLKEINEIGNNFRGVGADLKGRIEKRLAKQPKNREKEYSDLFGVGAYGVLRDHLAKKLLDIWIASTGQFGVDHVLAENIRVPDGAQIMGEYNQRLQARDDYRERIDSAGKLAKKKRDENA